MANLTIKNQQKNPQRPPCLGKFGWPVAPANCKACGFEKECRQAVIRNNVKAVKHVKFVTIDFVVDKAGLEINEKGRNAIHSLCRDIGGKKFEATVSKSGGYIIKIPKENSAIFVAGLLAILYDSKNVDKLPLSQATINPTDGKMSC